MVRDPTRFYHSLEATIAMSGLFDGRKAGDTTTGSSIPGSIEWVTTPAFCEMRNCPNIASWRIRFGPRSVDCCRRHTLSAMRNYRLWLSR